MLPEVKVHAPRGLRALPKFEVQRRTVLHYEPSWLLLSVPLVVLAARRARAGAKDQTASETSPGTGDDAASAAGRRRRSSGTARTLMTGGVECVREDETVLDAARKMNQFGVGALPICGADERLKGMITDRDIVVKVLAQGLDPSSTKAGQLAQGKPVTIGADDSLPELVRTMAQHQVKRLPVIDGHRLVGVVSEADVAEHATPRQLVAVVRGVYDQTGRRRFSRRGSSL